MLDFAVAKENRMQKIQQIIKWISFKHRINQVYNESDSVQIQ